MNEEKYWFIQRSHKTEDCPHTRWCPMTTLREEPCHPTLARYNVYVTEECLSCGEWRERFIGKSSYGTSG